MPTAAIFLFHFCHFLVSQGKALPFGKLVSFVKTLYLPLIRQIKRKMIMQRTNEMGTAVVTGASSGLGEVFAERLAQRGYDLILVARREERLEKSAKKLREQYSIEVENIVADLSAMADLEKVADAISGNAKITMLVNNAGTSTLAPFTGTPVQKQLAMINLNITALTLLSGAVLPGFKQRDRGTLINIGSAVGFHSLAFTGIYSGTKVICGKLYARTSGRA